MQTRSFLELLLLSFIWGSSFMWMRIAVPEFGPILLIEVRLLVSAMVLLIPLLLTSKLNIVRRNWKHILISGLLSAGLPFPLIAFGALYAPSGYLSLLNATVPMWSVVVMYLWLNEKPTLKSLIGVLIGFGGILVLSGDEISLSDTLGLWVVIALLVATLFYALTGGHDKRYMQGVDTLAVAAGGQFFSALILLPLAVIYWPPVMPSIEAWSSAILLGVFCTAFAFILFYRLLRIIGVTRTVSVTYLIPLCALFLGAVFLNEEITFHMLLGGALVLLGVGFVTDMIPTPKWLVSKQQ